MCLIKFDGVSKSLADKSIVRNISLTVRKSEVLVIMGPSGCGKTTLLRMMAGDIAPDSGVISHWVPDYRRHIGFVLQRLNVFPWLTVAKNIEFGLHGDAELRRRKVANMLGMLGLDEFYSYYPAELSGGMLQRVAIGRSLILEPTLILMDEPFTGLDYARRKELHGVLRRLQEGTGTTVVLVTHDVQDAIRLGNRIVVLSERPGSIRSAYDDVRSMDTSQRQQLAHEFLDG